MTAYAIFIRERTIDQSELKAYSASAGPTLARHDAKPIVAYGAQEVIEGPDLEGAVIVKFPSSAARAWYNSPSYREAREHRFKGADYRAVIVEGL